MGLNEALIKLVNELDRIHSDAMNWREEFEIPTFVTVTNGMQCHFTREANKALRELARIIHSNRSDIKQKIELDNYLNILRQVVAEMYAEGEFSTFLQTEDKETVNKLKNLTEEHICSISKEYTHYFPAWTLGMERSSKFKIGPVSFLSRNDWIDAVDFPQSGKDQYLGLKEVNNRWKEILKDALQNPTDRTPIEGLAGAVYSAIDKCPSLLKVTIHGYEKNYSRKLAKLVCKMALDAVSLCFGDSQFFHQQALQEERLPPFGSYTIVETDGHLWLPGNSLSKRIPILDGQKVNQQITVMNTVLTALASIIEGLVNPTHHKYPKLANRWATALDWFGEAHRESSDAIAVTKFGTSLDVLSAGGKFSGILSMVTNLTGAKEEDEVIKEPSPCTLKKLVKRIYDDGRSKILHGTYYDRLESFNLERQQAAYLARIVLIESALRLEYYSGEDIDEGFRTMPSI